MIFCELFVFGQAVTFNESLSEFFDILWKFVDAKIWRLLDVIIDLVFVEIVSNVKYGEVVGGVFVVNEDILT